MKLRDGLRAASRTITKWGFDRGKALERARGMRWVRADRAEYNRQRRSSARPGDFPLGVANEIFRDRWDEAGEATGHYFHQDLVVAREIFTRAPRRHIDVGSRLDGFVAHVASFRDIEVLDVRPLHMASPHIAFLQQDVMALDSSFRAVTTRANPTTTTTCRAPSTGFPRDPTAGICQVQPMHVEIT